VADDGGAPECCGMIWVCCRRRYKKLYFSPCEIEPLMSMLMQYRFSEGRLKGQCFGNLFLAAMNGISKNFEQAVKRVSDVLRVTAGSFPLRRITFISRPCLKTAKL
jgi:hypothetical protein